MKKPPFAQRALSALGRRTEAPPIAWLMEYALAHPEVISLAAGFTDNATLPVAETREMLQALLKVRRTAEPALQYGTTAGLPALRELTARRWLAMDQAAAAEAGHPAPPAELYEPRRVLIGSGSQQLLYLLTEVLCDPGDVVLVEDPTYFVYLGIAQSHALDCRGVRMASDGLDLAALEARLEELKREGALPRLKLLYLVTYHQNPTGRSTAFARKTAALELLRRYERAAGHPIYLLEDAAYRELRFAGADVPSALAADAGAERVLLTGTYSKPFSSGLRVGFGLLPDPVRTQVARVKSNHDFGTASLAQHLLAGVLSSGAYDCYVAAVQRRYARKSRWMTAAIRAHFPAAMTWERPTGGLYVWAAAPRRVRTGLKSPLFQRALDHRVLYVPGRLCYATPGRGRAPDHELRLSYGNASRREIETGIERLGAALRESLQARNRRRGEPR